MLIFDLIPQPLFTSTFQEWLKTHFLQTSVSYSLLHPKRNGLLIAALGSQGILHVARDRTDCSVLGWRLYISRASSKPNTYDPYTCLHWPVYSHGSHHWGDAVPGTGWVEPTTAARRPTMRRAAPPPRTSHPQMSIMPRLRNPSCPLMGIYLVFLQPVLMFYTSLTSFLAPKLSARHLHYSIGRSAISLAFFQHSKTLRVVLGITVGRPAVHRVLMFLSSKATVLKK